MKERKRLVFFYCCIPLTYNEFIGAPDFKFIIKNCTNVTDSKFIDKKADPVRLQQVLGKVTNVEESRFVLKLAVSENKLTATNGDCFKLDKTKNLLRKTVFKTFNFKAKT